MPKSFSDRRGTEASTLKCQQVWKCLLRTRLELWNFYSCGKRIKQSPANWLSLWFFSKWQFQFLFAKIPWLLFSPGSVKIIKVHKCIGPERGKCSSAWKKHPVHIHYKTVWLIILNERKISKKIDNDDQNQVTTLDWGRGCLIIHSPI